LDGEHTVFGKVISGMEVVDALSKQPTDNVNWPLERVAIRMEAKP
jgi:peptidyl-prolyl cis-trans isomerase A (cyclophilin A)